MRLIRAATLTALLSGLMVGWHLLPASAALVLVCDRDYDPVSDSEVTTNCRYVDSESAEPRSRSSVPMMWIREGVLSAGIGYTGPCKLVPLASALPANHYRVSAEDCGFEARPSREDVERMVHSLSASLRVPDPTISIGPDPSVNEWNMAVVGHPLWLWTDTPRTASSTNSGGGMTITIQAELKSLTFAMGDGKTVTCTTWTPYGPTVPAGAPSPTCGHTYTKPSLPRGNYTIDATADWTARWSAMGYSGTLPLRSTSTRSVPVGELQAVVIRQR